jgi:hypothetical protein
VCTHLIDPMGIHVLCCAYDIKHTKTHDAVHNIFVAIVWNVSFHMGWEQLHAFPSATLNLFRQQVNIVLTRYEICTLINIVIANPTNVNLFPWSCTTQRFVVFDAVLAIERNYCDWDSTNQFFFLAIQIF